MRLYIPLRARGPRWHIWGWVMWTFLGAAGIIPIRTRAQQRSQYTQYLTNQLLINPAVAGTARVADLRSGYRLQWAGFTDAPRSFYATAHTPLQAPAEERQMRTRAGRPTTAPAFHSLGLVVQRDQTGPMSRMGAYAVYAYNRPLTPRLRASLGVQAGVQQFALDADRFILRDPSASTLTSLSRIYPDLGIGGWLYGRRAWVGLSVLQVMANQFSISDRELGIYRATRHVFLSAGVERALSRQVVIIPSTLLKYTSGLAPSADLNVRLRFEDLVWAGVGYRTQDALTVLAGITVAHRLDIGYSYDAAYSALARYQRGSHEVMVGYRFVSSRTRAYDRADPWR